MAYFNLHLDQGLFLPWHLAHLLLRDCLSVSFHLLFSTQ